MAKKINAYNYYTDQLFKVLNLKTINFSSRAKEILDKKNGEQLNVLSLASGAARIEEGIFSELPDGKVNLTLVDLNPDLIDQARDRFKGKIEVNASVQNLNEISLPQNTYDIVLCVSAMHHVVELEVLIDGIYTGLVPNGEFWSIGEYVGRNGTRLYDDAYEVANNFFMSLPDKYRINRNPGTGENLDAKLPNYDCSINCFEGIRSEDILPLLNAKMKNIEGVCIDCFLWRFLNLAYLDNYDLENNADMKIIEELIKLEVNFNNGGGIPTSYNGVFVKT